MEFTYICKISLALESNRYPIVVSVHPFSWGGVYTECVYQQADHFRTLPITEQEKLL